MFKEMKSLSEDEDDLPETSQPNPFSFKNFSLKNDLIQADDKENEIRKNSLSFKAYFEEDENLELPDIDSALLSPGDLDGLPQLENVPIELDFDEQTNMDFFDHDSDGKNQNSKELIAKQKVIIASLEKRVKELESKEESEAKTLELLVQQVEKNLEKTTARAIEAERNLEILKQEATQMKNQIKLLKNENQILKSKNGKDLFIPIKKIANDLNTAALSAEKSLSFLNNGVETLKLIASNLESLEKFKEVND